MTRKFKPTTVTIPDFLLISGQGGDSCYQTTKAELLGKWSEAYGYDHFGDAEVIEICLADRKADPITEDMAKEWWRLYGEPNSEVPAIFAKHLTDEIEAVAHRDIAADRADAYREGMRA